MAKKESPKPTRLHPIAESHDGNSYLMEVCSDKEDSSERQIAVCTRSKPGESGPLGAELGTMKTLEDGHVEFHPIDKSASKIEVEDQTSSKGKGPAKYSSRAFRDGWARTFGGKN